jgi:hypothetical protein
MSTHIQVCLVVVGGRLSVGDTPGGREEADGQALRMACAFTPLMPKLLLPARLTAVGGRESGRIGIYS